MNVSKCMHMFVFLLYELTFHTSGVVMKAEDLDEEGNDEEGVFRSHEPVYDGIGIRCINFLLFILYAVLTGGAITGIVLPCVWPNTPIPIIISFAIAVVLTVVHLSVKILGKACINGLLLYPMSPKWFYQVTDGVLVFMLVGVVASFVLDLVVGSGPTVVMPMLGCWVVGVAMLINFHLVWRITYEGPAAPPDVKFVERDTRWEDFRNSLSQNGF